MQIEDLQVVLKVAQFGSITAAANSLDMQVATASAAVKRVEKTLGAELFVRSTRNLRLSRAGEHYLPECEKALQILQVAGQNLRAPSEQIEGELRLAMSSDLGRNLLIPWLDELTDKYPNLKLKVNISDSNIDFYRDSVDLAFRYGSPQDSNLFGFKICDVEGLLCASPDYVKQHGAPQSPQDLVAHNGLFYQLYDTTHDIWTFSKAGQTHKIKMQGDRTSNDGDLVRRWCVAGKGVAVKSCLDMANDLLAGRVVPLMTDYQPRTTELWLICPSRQIITPGVRLLRDFVRQKCDQIFAELRQSHFL